MHKTNGGFGKYIVRVFPQRRFFLHSPWCRGYMVCGARCCAVLLLIHLLSPTGAQVVRSCLVRSFLIRQPVVINHYDGKY